jgi:hypothetical protein
MNRRESLVYPTIARALSKAITIAIAIALGRLPRSTSL